LNLLMKSITEDPCNKIRFHRQFHQLLSLAREYKKRSKSYSKTQQHWKWKYDRKGKKKKEKMFAEDLKEGKARRRRPFVVLFTARARMFLNHKVVQI